LKRFVDDIAIEVIEAKLISPLYNIFSPITVTSMPAELVTSIAGETEENRAQREQLNKQLEVLMKGIETCKRFVGVRILGKIVPGLSICELSLIWLVGVDDSTIQSENTPNSADYDPKDSDEASDDSTSDDVRSLVDSLDRVHRSTSPPPPEPFPPPREEAEVEGPQEEILFVSSASKKARMKKSWWMAW